MGRVKQFFADRSYANTIFFQPVSGRLVVTCFLVMTTGTFVLAFLEGGFDEELFLIAPAYGLIFTFWGLLFVALARFLWANLVAVVRVFDSPKADALQARTSRWPRWLTPETAAVLAALFSILCSAGPVEAAVIGIATWCFGKYGVPILRRIATPEAADNVNAEARPE